MAYEYTHSDLVIGGFNLTYFDVPFGEFSLHVLSDDRNMYCLIVAGFFKLDEAHAASGKGPP